MQIHLVRGGQREGPFTVDQVRALLAEGRAQPSDLAWYEGLANWQPLQQILAEATPAGPPPLTPAMPVAGVPYSRPVTDGLAVASLVLGVLGLTLVPFICSLPAVVCGHLSLGRIRRATGALAGHGLAVGGLVTEYFGVLIWGTVLAIVLTLVGAATGDSSVGKEIKALTEEITKELNVAEATVRAERLAGACKAYARDHEGRFPEDLEALLPKYLSDRSVLRVRCNGASRKPASTITAGRRVIRRKRSCSRARPARTTDNGWWAESMEPLKSKPPQRHPNQCSSRRSHHGNCSPTRQAPASTPRLLRKAGIRGLRIAVFPGRRVQTRASSSKRRQIRRPLRGDPFDSISNAAVTAVAAFPRPIQHSQNSI